MSRLGVGIERDVRIEFDPIDDVVVVGRTALGLPSLVNAEPDGLHVVGDLHARRGDPVAHAGAKGIEPLVHLRRQGGGARRRYRPDAVRVGHEAALKRLDRPVVQRIVQRQIRQVTIGFGDGDLQLEIDLVGQAVNVPQFAFDRRIDVPHRQRGADADLPVGAVQRFTVEGFAPMAQFTQRVGHDFHLAGLKGPIEFLAANQAFALPVELFPRHVAEGGVGRIGRRRGNAVVGIAGRGMLEPGETVAQQRLAQPEVIAPRQPLRLRDERIGLDRSEDVPGDVVFRAASARRRWSGPSARPIPA